MDQAYQIDSTYDRNGNSIVIIKDGGSENSGCGCGTIIIIVLLLRIIALLGGC